MRWVFFHTYSWNCVKQVLESQRNINSAVFQPLLWLVLTLVCLHSPSCALFLALTIITQITSFAMWFFFQIQYNGDINPVSEGREPVSFSLKEGQRVKVPLLFWAARRSFLPNIDGKTLIFAIGISPVFQKCPWMVLFWIDLPVETHVLSYCTGRSCMF